MCPTPVQRRRRVGEHGQRGQRRGQLADVGQVGGQAVHRAGAPHGQPGWCQGDLAAHPVQQRAELVDRLGAAVRPAPQGDLAAGDQGGGEERHRAGEVRLDLPAAPGERAGLDRPHVGGGVVDGRPGGPQHLHGHPQVRRGRHRRADVPHHHAPGRSAGAASSSPETNWLDAEASMTTSPPVTRAGAVHGQRQAAGRRRRRSGRRASAARRSAGRAAGCGRAGRRRR